MSYGLVFHMGETAQRLAVAAPPVAGCPRRSPRGRLGSVVSEARPRWPSGEQKFARRRRLLVVAAARAAEPAGVGAARLRTAAGSSAAGVVARPRTLSAADVHVALRPVKNAKRAWVERKTAVRAAKARARDAELEKVGIC